MTAPTDATATTRTDGAFDRWARRLRIAAGAVLLAALVIAAVSSWVISNRYQPLSGVADLFEDADAALRPSPWRWVRTHEISLAVAVGASLWWAVLSIVLVRARSAARIVAVVLASAATFALTLLASFTWGLVAWDQAALWSVTVGTNLRGLWRLAFSDEVRFLLIDGAEVGQDTYRLWLLAHLAAPVLAALSLAVGWALTRTSTPRSAPQE